jgi:hypothetical protein
MVFSALSTTEVTIGHLAVAIIAKKEEMSRRQVKRQGNARLFFSLSGTVHIKFNPEGVTVNKHCYKEILRCLCNSTHGNNPEHWSRNNWLLLEDNIPAHHSVLA